jgi:hypothetical protein
MDQSNIIFLYLLIAFVIFITMRNELGTYMGFVFGATSSPVAGSNAAAGNTALTQLAATAATGL